MIISLFITFSTAKVILNITNIFHGILFSEYNQKKIKFIAYFGNIRPPIPGTSGQYNGIIRTAFR